MWHNTQEAAKNWRGVNFRCNKQRGRSVYKSLQNKLLRLLKWTEINLFRGWSQSAPTGLEQTGRGRSTHGWRLFYWNQRELSSKTGALNLKPPGPGPTIERRATYPLRYWSATWPITAVATLQALFLLLLLTHAATTSTFSSHLRRYSCHCTTTRIILATTTMARCKRVNPSTILIDQIGVDCRADNPQLTSLKVPYIDECEYMYQLKVYFITLIPVSSLFWSQDYHHHYTLITFPLRPKSSNLVNFLGHFKPIFRLKSNFSSFQSHPTMLHLHITHSNSSQ